MNFSIFTLLLAALPLLANAFAAPAEGPTPCVHFKIMDILGEPGRSGSAFLSDTVLIRVEGLAPDADVTLRLSMDNKQSEAVFRAGPDGAVDISKQAPLSGAYKGVDPGRIALVHAPERTGRKRKFRFSSGCYPRRESFNFRLSPPAFPGGVRAFEFKSTRTWDILNKPDAIESAMPPVEKISAPVLFNAADDDALWPSLPLSRLGFQRRVDRGVSARDEFYLYEKTGHVLGTPPGLPSPETYFLFPDERNEYWELGGTAQTNDQARLLSTRRNLRFLAKHLK